MQLGAELHSTVFRTELKDAQILPWLTPEMEKMQAFAKSKEFSDKCTVHARNMMSLAPDSEITEAGQ